MYIGWRYKSIKFRRRRATGIEEEGADDVLLFPAGTIATGASAVSAVYGWIILLALVIMALSTHFAIAVSFEARCAGSDFASLADAHSYCLTLGSFLASPITAADHTVLGFITSSVGNNTLLINVEKHGNTRLWRWGPYGPYAGLSIYVTDGGSVNPVPVPWVSTAVLDDGGTNIGVYTADGWDTVSSFSGRNCVICQQMTCSEICSVEGTQNVVGTSWDTCTCQCYAGFKGNLCQFTTSVHCEADSASPLLLATGMQLCKDKGGFLATPNTLSLLGELRAQYPLDANAGYPYVLVAGDDTVVSGEWAWRDGPLVGHQFYQGWYGSGYGVNGFPASSYFNGAEPNNAFGVESQIVAGEYNYNDCGATTCHWKCYACQYTGCDVDSPCSPDGTASTTGTQYTDCTCNCKDGYSGKFCECPFCDERGGDLVSGLFGCNCVCRPNHNGVNCNETTATPTMTATSMGTVSTLDTYTVSKAELSQTVSPSVITQTRTITNTSVITSTSSKHLSLTISKGSDTESLSSSLLTTPSLTASDSARLTPSLSRKVPSVNDPSTIPCPATLMTIYTVINGTRTAIAENALTDRFIRMGGVVVNISLSHSVDAYVEFQRPAIFTFGVESLGVSDPRSFPSVVNLDDIACQYDGSSLRTVLCELPASPDYTIREAEMLRVTADVIGTTLGACIPSSGSSWVVGTARVSPAVEDKFIAAQQVTFAIVSSITTAVVSLLGDGSPIETQLLVMMLDGPCASSYDRTSVAWVKYMVVPFGSFGLEWSMMGNIFIAIVFFLLHFTAVLILKRIRGEKRKKGGSWQQVRTTLLFPGVTVSVAQVMYAGAMYGTMGTLRTETGGRGALSILGLIFLLLVPGLFWYILFNNATATYHIYDWAAVGVSSKWAWLYPHGFWSPKEQMLRLFGILGPYRLKYVALSPFVLGLGGALLMAALPGSILCDYLYVGVGVMGLVLGVVMLVGNPCRSRVQSILSAISLILLGLLAILQIVAIRTKSDDVILAKGGTNYVLIGILALRAIHSIFVFVVEFRSKDTAMMHMREKGATIENSEDGEGGDYGGGDSNGDDSSMDELSNNGGSSHNNNARGQSGSGGGGSLTHQHIDHDLFEDTSDATAYQSSTGAGSQSLSLNTFTPIVGALEETPSAAMPPMGDLCLSTRLPDSVRAGSRNLGFSPRAFLGESPTRLVVVNQRQGGGVVVSSGSITSNGSGGGRAELGSGSAAPVLSIWNGYANDSVSSTGSSYPISPQQHHLLGTSLHNQLNSPATPAGRRSSNLVFFSPTSSGFEVVAGGSLPSVSVNRTVAISAPVTRVPPSSASGGSVTSDQQPVVVFGGAASTTSAGAANGTSMSDQENDDGQFEPLEMEFSALLGERERPGRKWKQI